MSIKIRKTNNPQDYGKVRPDFIYNRFDLFCSEGEFEAIELQNGSDVKYIQYRINQDQAELALWLVQITEEELDHLLFYITRQHPQVKKITYKNGILSRGKAKEHNHFRIIFPETVEEMESSISSKSRAKMRKKLNHAEEAYGKMELVEYDRSNMPEEIVETFFKFKHATRNRVYNMTPTEYLDRYHVSHCYVVKFADTVGAIRFSCEQCPVVYGENFTYNPELSDYSLGRFIFMHHLKRMVEKKHTELFFAGGNFEYKTHYGSIEETLYDCVIDVAELDFTELINAGKPAVKLKKYLKAHIPPRIWSVISKIRWTLFPG